MTAPSSAPPPTPSPVHDGTRKHLRGSSLLLAGRGLSLLLNFCVQVLTVRALIKADFGAFGWALSIVSFCGSFNLLGMGKTVGRSVSVHQQRGEARQALGVIAIALGAIVGFGVVVVLVAFGLRGWLDGRVSHPQSVALLLVLISLAPAEALDNLFQSMASIFVGARAIFFRRHLLGPLLKLAAVTVVLVTDGGVLMLATGYLAAGWIGVLVYVTILYRALRRQGWLTPGWWRALPRPTRSTFAFALPVMSTDLAQIFKITVAVLCLDAFHDAEAVAAFRAVLPVAGLNLLVLQSFKLMYLPAASRLFAQEATREEIHSMYWRTTLWIALVTFPVFAVCVVLAEPVTVHLFESRYASSGAVLAVLSLGQYFNAATGLNTYTLSVFGRVRVILVNNVAAALAAAGLCFTLVPRYGAVGAAWATSLALILQNLLQHFSLHRSTTVNLMVGRFQRVYLGVAVGAGALWALSLTVSLPPLVQVLTIGTVSAILWWLYSPVVAVGEVFPELRRIPVLGPLLARG